MKTGRYNRRKRHHYCLLVNREASNYDSRPVEKLILAIKQRGESYTILEPDSASSLLRAAQIAAGLRRNNRLLSDSVGRRGKIGTLVSCGGDGTFNLVARCGMEAGLPVAILPLGKFNNIARSLKVFGSIDEAVTRILKKKPISLDSGTVANQIFFGSIGIGYVVELWNILREKKTPRFGYSWSRVGSRAADITLPHDMILTIDSFRFEIRPTLLSINLLPYTVGLPFSPASGSNGHTAEIIFDVAATPKRLGGFLRDVAAGKVVYGSDIRQFRGRAITLQRIKGEKLYLDGELIKLPTATVEVKVTDKKLQVYC